MPLHLDGI
jgi:hypothetical protein